MDRFFYTYTTDQDLMSSATFQRIDEAGWVVSVIEISHSNKVQLRQASERFPLSIGPVDPDDLTDFDEGDYWGREISEAEFMTMWNTFISLGLKVSRPVS